MANIVGTIKGYYDGAQTVANIYDSKPSTGGETKVLMHFDSSATADECGNTWTIGSTGSSNKALYLGSSNDFVRRTEAIPLSGNFTVDFWIYQTSSGGNLLCAHNGKYNTLDFPVGCNTFAPNIYNYFIINKSGNLFSINEWHHIALVRNGTTVTGFIDGKSIASATFSNQMVDCTTTFGSNNWTGYVDDFRISDNIARWTSNFTPPTRGSISKDSYTKVLMKFDSSVTADECGNTWTATGSPTIAAPSSLLSTTQKKIGTSALYLDGTNYLQISGGITLGGQDFTIDFWGYMDSTSKSDTRFFDFYNSTTDHIQFGSHLTDATTLRTQYNNNNGSGEVMANFTVTAYRNLWKHIAIIYIHSTSKLLTFVDGEKKLEKNVSFSRKTYQYARLGFNCRNSSYLTGYIDEFRITDGKAMWTADFTPPTSAYTKTTPATVNTNMMIRHNGANCYIPLTSDISATTKPCLAVRHGSTNYYVIK